MSEPAAGVEPAYPLTLRVAGRRCVVVGGGPVAARRAQGLVEAGAVVTVVAPYVCEDLADAVADGRVAWVRREYLTGDLDDAWVVHAATGEESVDTLVCADAERQRVWSVRASDAASSAAWVPAVARSQGVTVAVNAGRDPRRAVRVRDAVAAALDTGTLPLRPVRRTAGAQGAGASDGGSAAEPSSVARASVARNPSGAQPGSTTRPGSVALVGGGPGALDLLTVRARQLLATADVVVIDRLAPRAVLDQLAPDVVVVDVGKTPGHHPVPQDEINALLVQHATAGNAVVRLKGGDPYVFGRGGEELDACRAAGIQVEVVPGVTSAISVPAAAGIPITHRGASRGFTVLTGHEDAGAVPAASDHTVVLLMGVSRLARTCAELVAHGRDVDTPVAVVEDGFGAGQRTTVGTLGTIAARAADAGVRPPAVTVVGDVVRRSPAWRESGSDGTATPTRSSVAR